MYLTFVSIYKYEYVFAERTILFFFFCLFGVGGVKVGKVGKTNIW